MEMETTIWKRLVTSSPSTIKQWEGVEEILLQRFLEDTTPWLKEPLLPSNLPTLILPLPLLRPVLTFLWQLTPDVYTCRCPLRMTSWWRWHCDFLNYIRSDHRSDPHHSILVNCWLLFNESDLPVYQDHQKATCIKNSSVEVLGIPHTNECGSTRLKSRGYRQIASSRKTRKRVVSFIIIIIEQECVFSFH